MSSPGSLTVSPIPILSDNYAWRLCDTSSGAVAVIDPADADAVIASLERQGGRLDLVLLTHHHSDHIAGAEQVARHFGARMVGAAKDAGRLPPLDIALSDGERVTLGDTVGEIIETPGHTRGHISYFFGDGPILFCGDTLFSLGCGRLLEGTAAEMFSSLQKLALLPDDTLICCGHEYTDSNARFAVSVDPGRVALQDRAREVRELRAKGLPTLPVRLGLERDTNLFLMARDLPAFAALRTGKDNFR